jgi:hypothetical protein
LLLHISFIYIIIIIFLLRCNSCGAGVTFCLASKSLHPHLATRYLEHKHKHKHSISLRNSLTFSVAAARPPFRKLIRRVIGATVSISDAKVSVASKPWSALHHLLDTLPLCYKAEYLFSCPSMQHIHFLNSIKTCFGLTRPSSVTEYSPPEVLALLCQFFSYVMLPAMC